MTMTRVLICGSSGLLGTRVVENFKKKNIPFIGTYNTNPIENGFKVDFMNLDSIRNIMKNNQITTCVNCVVERRVDVCESDWNETKRVNIDITNNIAKVCKEFNVHIIHISTDYVFDGLNPPYTPTSDTNPLQNYGISKLISEQRVRRHTSNHTIIRVPVLYSEHPKCLSESAVSVIGKKILDRTKIYTEDNFSVRRPLYIDDLCNFISDGVIENIIGTCHFGNPNDKVTKYIMAKKIAKYLGKPLNVNPINLAPRDGADRPIDTQLVTEMDAYNFTSIDEGLARCFSKFKHPKLMDSPQDVFLLIDLDGTLVDTDEVHYKCYNKVLGDHIDVKIIVETVGIDAYLRSKYNEEEIKNIKQRKLKYMLEVNGIKFMKNAETLIHKIEKLGINHCVVTNTNRHVVDHFKQLLPTLNKLKNWITREDYTLAKPNSECYNLAISKYHKNDQYIMGIENSRAGFEALKGVTDCIYLINEDMKSEDAFIINDLNSIF
jgi:S-adenosylmethionine synthetase